MALKVFARFDSAAARFVASGADEPALLLEGAWPAASTSRSLWSLDEAIDGRFAWIDAEAARLAAKIECAASPAIAQAGYIHALALRYYLVRILRPIVFFQQVLPATSRSAVDLSATAGCDDDYAMLLAELAGKEPFNLRVQWQTDSTSIDTGIRQPTQPPKSSCWRKLAGRMASWLDRRPSSGSEGATPRFILCGNPRLLDPVCQELVAQRLGVDWLYECFAVRTWLRWCGTGVGQLVCHSVGKRTTAASTAAPAEVYAGSLTELSTQGNNIGSIVGRWLWQRTLEAGDRWSGFQANFSEHLRSTSTAGLVLDQDATPLARAAVAAAKALSIPTWVVQHGVTGVRFGFAPLAADRFLAADTASQQQLIDWGVHRERVDVTGSPAREALPAKLAAERLTVRPRQAQPRPLRFLLLASTPARDERPDSVTFHLTTRTYDELTEMACRAVATVPGAELLIKPHPRDPAASVLGNCLADFPTLPASIVHQPLERLLHDADVVLSCASTAGVDAAALGWPVVQLLPRGSGELLPAQEYGMLGTARSFEELVAWLPAALHRAAQRDQVSAPITKRRSTNLAARRIVELIYLRGADDGGSPFAPHRATVSMSNCRSIGLAR